MSASRIAWCSDSEDEEAHPRYEVLNPAPNTKLRGFPLELKPLCVWTHWGTRTTPCFHPATCPLCKIYQPRRKKGYLAMAALPTYDYWIAELTPPVLLQLKTFRQTVAPLDTTWLEIGRKGAAKNSRMTCVIHQPTDKDWEFQMASLFRGHKQRKSLPPVFPVWQTLLAIWGFSRNQFAELRPESDND